jgi:hypothetical protein
MLPAILAALHDQDWAGYAGQVGAEVLQPRGGAAERGCRGCPDGDVEAVLPGLVTGPGAAEQIDVVRPV